MALSIVFLGVVVCAISTPHAETLASDIARGRGLAEQYCADCHAIGRLDESPTRVNADTAFRDLHKRFPIEMLVKAGQTGMVEGHDEMPAFVFIHEDAKALLAYIDSLAPDGAGTYVGGNPHPSQIR